MSDHETVESVVMKEERNSVKEMPDLLQRFFSSLANA